ncbi:MAG: hypothetical protein IJD22_08045 [Clostridia bacterium]|nr:hypothetical protein [Clostridia bacterium]
MKKLFAIVLALVLVFSLFACGTDTENGNENDGKTETTVKDEGAPENTDAHADEDPGKEDENSGEYSCETCGKQLTIDDACIVAGADGQIYMCPDCYNEWLELE